MKRETRSPQPLAAWSRIPARIRSSIRRMNEGDLDRTCGSDGWTVRETVHHLVEANLVASNMIIAALAADGCDFDWTWVHPDKSWMRRVGYDRVAVDGAVRMLSALCRHIAGLIAVDPAVLRRTVRLNDAPGAKRYVMTVEKILRQEVEHADDHLGDILEARNPRR